MKRKKYVAGDVKYTPGDEYLQSLLRLALYDAWNGRCHWCGSSIPTPALAEIDHIIPKAQYRTFTTKRNKLLSKIYKKRFLKKLRKMPHSPDEVLNLAPICGRDNRMKNDTIDMSTVVSISESLKKARKKEHTVVSSVMAMTRAKGITRSFVDLVALPHNENTAAAVEKWGAAVVGSLWEHDKAAVENFRVPRDFQLKLEPGMVPDWLGLVSNTGDGVDSLLHLTLDEQAAISGAIVLFEFNDLENKLAQAISQASQKADAEMTQLLKDRGVGYPDDILPRWTNVEAHLETGAVPSLTVTAKTDATIGGSVVLNDDNDGRPQTGSVSMSFTCVIACQINLARRDVKCTWDLDVTDEDTTYDEN